MRCIIATGLILLAAACGPKPAPPASATLVFGGEPVPAGAHPAVVALAFRKTSADAFAIGCTGALVAPKVVLTAGHCVTPLSGEIAVYAGAGVEGGMLEGDASLLAVERVVAHPQLRAHPVGYADYGLVVLKEPVTGIAPLTLLLDLRETRALVAPGSALTLVGFGRRENDGTGVKMQVQANVASAGIQEFVVGGQGRDACTGDSGGPVLAGGKLAGVVSRGLKLGCGDGGYAGLAAEAACWIEAETGASVGARGCAWRVPEYDAAALDALTARRLCAKPNRTQRETIEALKVVTGAGSCREAAATLAVAATLDLSGTRLRDVSPIVALAPRLETLALDGNRIERVAPLARLASLKTLSLVGNDARDLETLAALDATVLGTRRQLSNYLATPFRAACGDPELAEGARRTVQVILFRTMAEECALANQRLLLLKTLSLKDRGITDVTPLAHLQGLQTLDLSLNAGLSDVTALAGLESLKKLDLTGTGVTDLTALAPLVARGLVISR